MEPSTRGFSVPLDLRPASSTISENKHLHEDDSPIDAAGRRLSRSGLDAPELVMQGAVFWPAAQPAHAHPRLHLLTLWTRACDRSRYHVCHRPRRLSAFTTLRLPQLRFGGSPGGACHQGRPAHV